MNYINLGIVGDGLTDYKIFGKVVECILFEEALSNLQCKTIHLEGKNIHDPVDRYLKSARHNENEYYLPSKNAQNLRDEVLSIILSAFNDFSNLVEVSYNDILLITTDTEHAFNDKNQYFNTWGISLSHILTAAIDKFYDYQVTKSFLTRKYLPVVVSIATFPSTEVIVGAAKGLINQHYGKKAKEWKRLLYSSKNPKEEDIQSQALDCITPDSIDIIFQDLPESRMFIQTLSLGLKRCLLTDRFDCNVLNDRI